MSNTMYLVCVHHPEQIHALRLANRGIDFYKPARRIDQSLERFLEDHKMCGGGFDHFTIAYAQTKDHDLPNPEPLADGVHLALREAANTPEA
jgi:hypothetical protein